MDKIIGKYKKNVPKNNIFVYKYKNDYKVLKVDKVEKDSKILICHFARLGVNKNE
ncbi:hypothetical protein SKUN_001461 [Spiroplasma kunkelii CR2-3x]|uniref:Uncharacterized protein n=1 Tax=Spiroplasma kunkelii CR2-3x TaxID=273035 RepID=A0A0K2JJC5_SPIKU|nr:hypothetical protein [Spiroplasma kunkelii]ALA98321.1 hypothetical protein SKUN_001461 [Spiroplasma kunkelii CR2-3x]